MLKSRNTVDRLSAQTAPPSPLTIGLRTITSAVGTVIVFSFFINLLMFISPLYMLQIYDRILSTRSTTTLIGITVLAGMLLLVYAALETLRSQILVRAGLRFDDYIAPRAFNAIHRGLLRSPGSNLVQGLRDVDTLREFLTGSGIIAFCDVPWFPVFVFAAFLLHPWFGWIALSGAAVIWSLTITNEVMTRRHLMEASKSSIEAGQRATATFRNIEVLQAMGMLSPLRSMWLGHHLKHLDWQARASHRAGALIAFTRFFRMFLQIVILGTGGYLAINREISPGAIVASSILIGRALQPMEMAVASWKGFVSARAAWGRLQHLFQIAGVDPERMPLPRPRGMLSLDGVIATAPGRREIILRNISFALDPGEVLCVIGPSAAGKSTLARVIVGVWPIGSGTIRLDGADLTHWNPHELGGHIGYLPQDVELFSGTVAQNIGRFHEEINPKQVIAAAEQAGCHDMIQTLSDGYNTQIGEGGQALSGGQRQRIALARALYGDPAIVVLDEPNASLDSAGEEALLAAIHGLKSRGKTIMLITHKVNILAAADRIAVLKEGALQAFGTCAELLPKLLGPRIVGAPPQPPVEATGAAAVPAEVVGAAG